MEGNSKRRISLNEKSNCELVQGAGLSGQEVRQVIVSYVKTADLQLPNNKAKVAPASTFFYVPYVTGFFLLFSGES
jgi:hypothetical protein